MKVAVLSESAADEAAVNILVRAILDREIESIAPYPLRSRGWPSVKEVVPSVMKYLYYRTDADAFILVVDSNNSPVHKREIGEPCEERKKCRLCMLREEVQRVKDQLTPVANREMLKTAIGLAIPAIEAWYLCGIDAGVNEAAWVHGLETASFPFSKNELKRRKYGTDRPSLELEKQFAVENAERLAGDIQMLEKYFPKGFGWLVHDIKRW